MGSSPMFPRVRSDQYSFLINHINIVVSKKQRSITFRCGKKSLRLAFILRKLGLLNFIIYKKGFLKLIKITTFLYRGRAFFSSLRQVTTPSKKFSIKLKSLRILSQSVGESIVLVETSLGIVTHAKAIELGVGGKILCVLS